MTSLTAELRLSIREARSNSARNAIKDNNGRGHSELVTPALLIALARLSPNMREAWIDRTILNRSLEDIGRGMTSRANPEGITRERVRQLEKSANDRLRQVLPDSWLEAQRREFTGEAT